MALPLIEWSDEIDLPVAPSAYPEARHASASGAMVAARERAKLTMAYLELLQRVGPLSDHEASRMLGRGLSSINSARQWGLKGRLVPSGEYEVVTWPSGHHSKRVRWTLR